MKIDSHQHFWAYDEAQYPWIAKGSPLHRDWLPTDLAPLLKATGFDGCVAVQARQTLAESRWLLALAEKAPIIKGVVGWVDLRSEKIGDELAELTKSPRFRGVRHVVQGERDDRFMMQPAFVRGIAQLHNFGLTYDLLVLARQLPAAIVLAQRFPLQPFVLDHIAKPLIKAGTLSPWREQIRELAKWPNVLCKVSGMVTEADAEHWKKEDFRPYLDVVSEAFGADRLMFGSDWPVCLRAASYAAVVDLAADYFSKEPADVQAKIFGGNAARFYGLAAVRAGK